MSATRIIAADSGGVAVAASATGFCPVANGQLVLTTTEANGRHTFRTAGTLSYLSARVVSGNRTASSPRVEIRINGVAGSSNIPLAPGGVAVSAGEHIDSVNTDHVNAGDTVEFAVYGGGSGNANWTFTYIGAIFTPDNTAETVTILGSMGACAFANASETSYRQIASGADKNTTQANGQWKVRIPTGLGTLTARNLYVYVSGNARTVSQPHTYCMTHFKRVLHFLTESPTCNLTGQKPEQQQAEFDTISVTARKSPTS